MKWLYFALHIIFWLPGFLATLNPYKHSLDLLNKEPYSGYYTKNEAAFVEELWLDQKVDHFVRDNTQTWKMRYFRNAKYHKPQGPIYIFVGGEWTISPGLMSTGLTHDMAVENSGMLFYTEHRYYGLSLPFGKESFKLENLKQLNLHQSLADLAHFIRHQKSENPEMRDSKVILVGGSYSGSLVAWMTQLYPELIAASWASSAPLLAKADFYEYMEVVSQSIDLTYGRNCSLRMENGFKHLVKLFNDNEIEELLYQFNSCEDYNPEDPLDRAAFFNGLGNYFALIIQSYSAYIPRLCENLMSLDSNDEVGFLKFLELLYSEGRRSSDCQDFGYSSMLELFSEDADQSSETRAWFYQTCNEFGWYTTTKSPNATTETFANQVTLYYFEKLCQDAFGVEQTAQKLAQGVEQTNSKFGGYAFNQSERYAQVIFTHGQLDPWRALGQQTGQQAIVLTGYSHVEDLASIRITDNVQMNLAKLRVMSFLRRHI
ncbi:LOW QUALITY PROTEIN: putative serine protease K12H4.7 [Drosophila eugracilis]|uniref:LOW QUALITY PROTEIN: putative serine protease K12H4.7 n=1 Tax=Drosophila eugracilis TaxID=29029 RepID=UPI001BDACE3D|nr:LOW QUALITY PROTEIN: putative serine protease K12H4.7 [Drosophila eugracilis]